MATIKPFSALRPQPDVAAQLASRPYDVLNSQEARNEAPVIPFHFYISPNRRLTYRKIQTYTIRRFMKKQKKI